MLRIERHENDEVVLIVYGRLETRNVGELSALLSSESTGPPLVLDLKDVILVNRDVIRFLGACEAGGIELRNCPRYIRTWIAQEAKQT